MLMGDFNIVPECFVDTYVSEIAGRSKGYNHQHGCGNVASTLKKKLLNRRALGIIDEDKNKGPEAKYFSEFVTIRQEHDLILKKHKDREHYLILVCPEMEKWLVKDAQKVNVEIESFELPKDLAELKKITKAESVKRNQDFRNFVKALIKERAPSITTLGSWIESFNNGELNNA